ncbi:ABC transporter ATP-binding protein [Ornithinicoccus hortensis]|uniref:ABC-type multidrug transport system fused ATPase/permease subunit n=1 Tax=Ornithinicoccus hortensis TaxID=82346 RepID=A0A542YSI4_9MICO|nr:ABC transporter ATP-binding protein [Ornithinicoccus hortensis]TQL51056.1 ABC-type multidrug transport system fused ATPase/permease subunit [Ornithinicoccus hortensis]
MTSAPGTRPLRPPAPTPAVLRRGLRVIWTGIKQQRGWFSVAVCGSVLWAGATVATAWGIGYVTDGVVTPAVAAGKVSAGGLWTIFLVLAGILVVNVLGVILRRVYATVAGFNLQAAYRRRVTRQYLRLPLSWHHSHPSGQLLSNAHSDVEATWQVFNPLPMAIGVLVMLVIAGTQMVLIDPFLALIGFLVFPGLFAANLVFQRVMAPKITQAQQLRAEVAEVAHESFEAGLVVKAMGREEEEADRFRRVTNDLRDSLIQVGRTRGTFEPVIEAIPTVGTLAVLAVGTAQVRAGHLSAAEVVQIAYLFSILAFPVRSLGWVLAELPRTVVGFSRVDAVLRARGSMEYGTGELGREGAAHSRTEAVDYAYEDRVEHTVLGSEEAIAEAAGEHDPYAGTQGTSERTPAIRGVTLDIPAGSTTALVGPTGSGKSTLTNLVLRLIDPDSGTVRLDGIDLRTVRQGEVPAVATLVAQQTFMFDDTVRDNVVLTGDGADRPDDQQVWSALRIAQADQFVSALPEGLDTVVGERGGSLSGGQRQRIALARAIIRHPRLLVLDDATSAVDPAVEQDILGGLREASDGMTVLVVAYRMATIMLADHIVYLERGRIRDQGSHEELLGRCQGYADLVTAYAREAAQRAAVAAKEEKA